MNRVLLVIFDGFGVNPNRAYNAVALAKTPNLDYYFANNSHTVIEASGIACGLPDGQFGNSEVGHLTLGSGRILKQDLLRITESFENGTINENPTWQKIIKENSNKRLHLIGLVSDGGVHSHIQHIIYLIKLLAKNNIEPVLHMITDGRDTPPTSAPIYLDILEKLFNKLSKGTIATVSGRYYAMDRAQNYDRVEKAYKAIVNHEGMSAKSAKIAIEQAYARGETDEFITPTFIEGVAPIQKDEAVLFFDFRADRMRQIVSAFGSSDFKYFKRNNVFKVYCMVEYDEKFDFDVLFKPIFPKNVLSEIISKAGLTQFHCAEKEKYAHVTYFFNGGKEEPFDKEDRVIVPSPNVSTYDLAPQMSACEVADQTIKAIKKHYDFIVINFANGDMVGHTAVQKACIIAVETLDTQFNRLVKAALEEGYNILLTADHGNCDEMVDPITGEPHTQHTIYPVPFLIIGKKYNLRTQGGICDIAPTVLDLLNLEKPSEMSGKSLLLKPTYYI
ncbi:phosphoglycerate mutase [Desulfurella multipotens]|uniref:2,3-bisphosphoglycerate-independent phosphoglycerate mutase n=1 Tax=Desulfurella multipotens TaxID=79269 RepID=A0A1G6LJ42_9BACT|nr:2,3-bisphosphoglycerate-independent phosphoglycerate mutase [Desulfurella multipotens]SDC43271.1 phosphoglycerate mutase [Desulfurella multipotens]